MKQVLTATLIFIALSAIACTNAAPTPTPTPQPTLSAVKSTSRVIAEGRVIPTKNATLSFQVSGLINLVPVSVGSTVKAGQVLAQLDSKQLELQLAQADANLASTQARFNQLKKGPTADDLASAQQNVKSAQIAYDKLLKPDANDLAMVKADLDKAQAALKSAQAAYDAIGGDNNPNAGMLPQRLQLQNAYLDLQKAQTAYNNKVNPPDAQVQQALAALQSAKNQLAKLTPSAEDLAGSEASLKAAQAARDLTAEQLTRAKLVAPFDGTVVSVELDRKSVV